MQTTGHGNETLMILIPVGVLRNGRLEQKCPARQVGEQDQPENQQRRDDDGSEYQPAQTTSDVHHSDATS